MKDFLSTINLKSKFRLCMIFLSPLISMLALEILNGAGVFKSPLAFFGSLILFYILYTFLYILFGRVGWAALAGNLGMYVLYIFNFYKKVLTGLVLSPADINFSNHLGEIMNFVKIDMYFSVIISFIILAAITVLMFFYGTPYNMKLKTRVIILPCYVMAFSLFSTEGFNGIFFQKMLKNSVNRTYAENSIALGFLTLMRNEDLRDMQMDNIDYSKELMDSLINKVEKKIATDNRKTNVSDLKPNVIAIMSEAFVDPTVWGGNVTFSQDPVPTLHELQKTATTGQIISPVFGGHTCNTEYEFLTGNAMSYVGIGHIPYQMPDIYVPDTDYRALPQIFKQNGYKTVGIHTYFESFFNRNVIYPRFGFDEYIGIESMPDSYLKGQYTSDEYFTTKIIEQIDNTDEPLFLFGISMQNHYTFLPDKYENLEITANSPNLDDYLNSVISTYTQGVYDADKQLGRLIEHIKESGKPTIVLFFGDHNPMLGNTSYEAFQALGMVHEGELTDWTLEERRNLFATPYAMWSNFDMPVKDIGNVSPYFMGPMLLENAGLHKNLYFQFLYYAYDKFHAMKTDLYVNQNDQYYAEPLGEDESILEMLYYFQYDRIAGAHYSDEEQAKMLK